MTPIWLDPMRAADIFHVFCKAMCERIPEHPDTWNMWPFRFIEGYTKLCRNRRLVDATIQKGHTPPLQSC